MADAPHLWLALSPHGFGHAAMTAPLVAELRRLVPGLRLTIQTALPREFLATRYDAFDHVAEIPDIGFRMKSSIHIDIAASAAFYTRLHADFAAVVAAEAARLAAARPDLVLANVPYVTIAAAAAAGIPVVAYSSINWADMADHYLGHLPDCAQARAQIRDAYGKARFFLRPNPAQPMTLANIRDIGPVARLGRCRGDEIRRRLGLEPGRRLGLIAFGGIDDRRLPMAAWTALDQWFWLSSQPEVPTRPDMAPWQAARVPFADLLPSVDVIVTKPGYGTFTEAGLGGIPVLYEPRPDWPEAAPLERWLAAHSRCLATSADALIGDLPNLLRTLFSLPEQPVAVPTGVEEGARLVAGLLACRQ